MIAYETRETYDEVMICKICKSTHDDPIRLPCNNSICSTHVKVDIKADRYKCKLCNQLHQVPPNGFAKNVELKLLLKMRDTHVPKESLLGNNNLKAKELCDKLDQLLEKSEMIANDPVYFINQYFSNLRATIDSEREKKIQMLNKHYLAILNRLADDEKKCLENECERSNLELNKIIKYRQDELDDFYELYDDPKLNDKKEWNDLKNKIEHSIRDIEYTLNKFQSELLLNKDYKFESKLANDESSFGNLKVLDIDLNEDKLEETIRFEITKFKSFVAEKQERYYDKWCVINGLPWKFIFEIKDYYDNESNYDLLLGAYSLPDCENQILKEQPFRALVEFKLLTTDGDVFESLSDEYVYDGQSEIDGNTMFSILDITNPSNKVYDKQNDSIKLELDIKIIKNF